MGWLRQSMSEGSMELFQQLQAFRVAHGLNNYYDGKERERLSAFISPMDIVQFKDPPVQRCDLDQGLLGR